MRKFLKIMALVLICIIALSAMTSCGRMYEGVQKKARKADFVCNNIEYLQMSFLNESVRKFGITGEVKSACYITNDFDEYAYLYEFDKVSAASAFANNFSEITDIRDESIEIRRDNKIVIAGKRSTLDKIW